MNPVIGLDVSKGESEVQACPRLFAITGVVAFIIVESNEATNNASIILMSTDIYYSTLHSLNRL